jgi:predicted O-methyltransferase YrrM
VRWRPSLGAEQRRRHAASPVPDPAAPDPAKPAGALLCWPLDHYYSPVPDNRALAREPARSRVWPPDPAPTPGIDWRDQQQVSLVHDEFAKQSELSFPDGPTGDHRDYHAQSEMFSRLDASMLAAMLRRFRPRRMIEVGCGWSSLVTARVNREYLDGSLQFTCIEPYPPGFLSDGIEGISELIVSPVEQLPLEVFQQLGEGDVLFIDTSHTVKTGGDVTWIFHEIIPRLRVGVVVHVHDVFLPEEYPESWVMEGRGWNESYLVRSFLSYNSSFAINWGTRYMVLNHLDAVRRAFRLDATDSLAGASLWFQRVR